MASKPDNGFGFRKPVSRAFSLVEVVIAMAIISFALIVVVGLLPIGLKSNRDSIEESQAINLIQAVIADRQASDYSLNSSVYNLPALNNVTSQLNGTMYVMNDIATTNAQPATASYRVTYSIYPSKSVYSTATNYPVSGPPAPVLMNLKVSWPAAQANASASVEMLTTFMQQ